MSKMSKEDDQRQQRHESDYTDKAGTAAGVEQPIVYPKLDAEGPTTPESVNQDSGTSDNDSRKWGTKVMGSPSAPSAHPQNQEAATWTAPVEHPIPNSYIVQPSTDDSKYFSVHSPHKVGAALLQQMDQESREFIRRSLDQLENWKQNDGCGVGMLNSDAKALMEGGFEAFFRHTFSVSPDEKLQSAYVFYLSTSTGPIAGTPYFSTVKMVFCSDHPL